MNRQLCTYALIKTLHDSGRSYVDIFIPFLLLALDINHIEGYTETSIQKLINDVHHIDIPIHIIRNILRSTNQLKYTTIVSRRIQITAKGMEYVHSFPTIKEVDRRINCFSEALLEFVNTNAEGREVQNTYKDELMDSFFQFIYENVYALLLFTKGLTHENLSENKYYFPLFKQFLIHIDKERPDLYSVFEDILLGSVICVLAKSGDTEKYQDYSKKRVFLDSNVVFSILGYHYDEFSIPCQELHQQLIKYKFQIYIFDFTLTQIISVLVAYRHEYHNYVDKVKVGSIYSNLKTKGITPTDIDEMIADFEDTLLNYNILVCPTSTEERTMYEKELDNKIENLKKYKHFETSRKSLIHDLLAIEYIRKMRKKDSRKFNDTNCFFVTADTNLTKYTFEVGGHKDNATISEVLLDSFITSILWVKNPGNNGVNTRIFMPLYSDQRIINKAVWQKFIEIALNLHRDGLIQKSDISMLIYNKEVQETLASIKDNDISQITPETIEDILSNTKNNYSKMEEDIDFYENMVLEKNAEINASHSQIEEIIEAFRNKINEEAEKSTRKILSWTKNIILFVLLSCGIFMSYLSYRGINIWVTYIAPIVGTLAFFGCVFNIDKFLEQKMKIRVYNFYLRKYHKQFVPDTCGDNVNPNHMLELSKEKLAG